MIKVEVMLNDDLLEQLQSHLAYIFNGTAEKSAPGVKKAFDQCTKVIQESWRGWAMGNSIIGIPNIKNPNAKLASSIKINRLGDFDAKIESNSEYAKRIQDGTPEYDMKKTYPYGNKSRVTKHGKNKGVPYLIIPFRWGTPNKQGSNRAHFGNTIPQAVYSIVKNKKKFSESMRESTTHFEQNARGKDIRRSEYTWGDRFSSEDENFDSYTDFMLNKYVQGMVKMTSEVGRGSSYFTFRIISAKSAADKWIRKEVEPIDVVSAVERETRPIVEELLQQGLESDLG